MSSREDSLKWSAQLQVAPPTRLLAGDKIILPQSALEALLAAAPVVDVQRSTARPYTSTFDPFNPYSFTAERYAREQLSDKQAQLPHPLTFRLANPQNGRIVFAGIREFSAEENQVIISHFLREALGLEPTSSLKSSREGTPNGDLKMVDVPDEKADLITIQAVTIPKGVYVRLRPLEAGYDPEDWKSLLERYLRDNFTTLTHGEFLTVPGARNEKFRFLVDKFEPEGDSICIIDTDLEVDIEALNEDQAKETLSRRLAKAKRAPGTIDGSSSGGTIEVGRPETGQILPREYVDYQLKAWDQKCDLEVNLETQDDALSLDILISPFSAHQRAKPRLDEHVFSQISSRPTKRLKLSHSNIEIEEAESLNIAVHAWRFESSSTQDHPKPTSYTISVNSIPPVHEVTTVETEPNPDEVVCQNCHQNILKRSLPLHEAFCYRNNVFCPKCSNVFLKRSDDWANHWHCSHDEDHGNDRASHVKHDSIFHPSSPLQCPNCDFEAFNVPILAQHRTTTCPAKEILCQFCHLIVPQQSSDDPSFSDPEVLLSGLTPHELVDGARTTECHICSKIVRLRDMKIHLRLHDRERLSRPSPMLCVNGVCGRTIKQGDEFRVRKEQLGLCSDCFGPLYVNTYDPEGKGLRRRIERKLLQQLIGGCGKAWCHNEHWCKTGHRNVTNTEQTMTTKDALPLVKPIMDSVVNGDASGLKFCVDETSQTRRNMAEMMRSEGDYELQWCVKALEEEKNDLGKAREWLASRAPRINEVVS